MSSDRAPLLALLTDDDARATWLALTLGAAGQVNLVRWPIEAWRSRAQTDEPAHVLAALEPARLLDELGPWADHAPCPVSLFGSAPDPVLLARLLAAGLAGWWPRDMLSPAHLASALARDAWHWRQRREAQDSAAAMAQQLLQLQAALEERRWVDRAKGLLMVPIGGGPSLSEEEAFSMLRSAAMHANLKLVDLARSLVQATQWAEAVNRAGQLRMLSQRLVKLLAQRQAGVEPAAAQRELASARQRIVDNLLYLQRLRPSTERQKDLALADGATALPLALMTVEQAWSRLDQVLTQRAKPLVTLAAADAAAAELLAGADVLVQALQALGGRPALALINLCGRQRMQVQRLAKEALLAIVLDEPARLAALPPMLAEVESDLAALQAAPLSTPAIQQGLQAVRTPWHQLGQVLRGGGPDAVPDLVQVGDAMLAALEQLTTEYEHSLQGLLA